MASTFPSILIIPGAWHPNSLYKGLADELEQIGFPTRTVSLLSLNSSDPGNPNCRADSDSIRQTLSALIDKEGKDMILLAYSYGGMPCGAAARGLSRLADRKLSGVVGLIYWAGIIVPEGENLIGYLGGETPPWVVKDNVSSSLANDDPFEFELITIV